ncbi:hypothetical protein [Goodfellowiella coeruleoviolacea]|uniref:Prealbumin-like fold domain-containing protein n=1 Tax=Goodfellowiella coeruleoviolacea TaxID=334858 RepID=A0AAE3KGS3_9PSEU|nr:hypothetical protein [Goodfellowiella coeruleoviolacea]MCP2165709.1 hypothetical protein [Goodfellowiella coeruleoviolacea]
MRLRRLVAGAAGTAVLAGSALLSLPGTAGAAFATGHGYETEAQPYLNYPKDKPDWLGSYVWNNQQVWCVQFAYKEPDTDEEYRDGDELRTKWGDALSPEVAADISYLLLRYTNTQSDDEAAALAHLLHSWTAGSTDPAKLDPNLGFREIAYNEQFHFERLPDSAKQAVERLRADATANHGPWTATLTAPKEPQLIGEQDEWTVQVRNAANKGLAGVPVTLELTDAEFAEGGATSGTVTTPADGGPLTVAIVPTGPNPSVVATLDSPADKPVVHVPSTDGETQRMVTTGGEKKITVRDVTTARTKPGQVKVAKTDAETSEAIAEVALRVTAADKTSPAIKQDDTPLLGEDGKPLVVRTGADGTAAVPELKTPQEICLVEVAPAEGYEEFYDASAPPSVCGTVNPGDTLALALTNKPNKPTVPSTIPAGTDSTDLPVATAAVITRVEPGGLVALGALGLLGSATAGLLVRSRLRSRR